MRRPAIVAFALFATLLVVSATTVTAADADLEVASQHTDFGTGGEASPQTLSNLKLSGSGDSATVELDYVTGTTTLEGFEDGDIAEYGGDTGAFSVTGSENGISPPEGTSMLKGNGAPSGYISDTGRTVSQGDTISVQTYIESGPESTFRFGVQSESGSFSGYQVKMYRDTNEISLARFDSGSSTSLATDGSASIPSGEWLTVEIQWGSSGGLTVTVTDAGGSEITQLSATDTTYSSGGIGFKLYSSTTYWDNVAVEAGQVAPNSAKYVSAVHDADAVEEAAIDIDTLTDASVTATVRTTGGTQLGQDTFTTAGNHTLPVSSTSASQLEVVLDISTSSDSAQFALADETLLFQAQDPTLSNAAPDGATVNDENVDLSIDMADADLGTAQGDSVTVEFYDAGGDGAVGGGDDSLIGSTSGVTSNQTVTQTWSNLGNGSHSWYAVASDSYGGSTTGSVHTFDVVHKAATASNLSPDGTTTNAENVDLSADISDYDFAESSGDSVKVKFYVDGSLADTQTVTSNQTVTYTATGLSDGSHSWHIETEDEYGLTSTSSTASFTVVHYAPVLSNLSPDGTSQNSEDASLAVDVGDYDFLESSGDSVTVEFYDAGGDGAVGGGDDSLIGSASGVTSNQTVSQTWSGLSEGTHTWYVVATDEYGLSTTSATATVTVNHYAPSTSNPDPPDGADLTQPANSLAINVSDQDFAVGDDSVTVEFYAQGPGETSFSSVGSASTTTNGSVSVSGSFDDGGTWQWYAVANDSYGHTTTSATFSYQAPATLEIRNESAPTKIVDNATVELRMYANETGSPQVFQRNTSDGTINMTGLPADVPFIVVADADGYYTRRIFVPSLYEQQSIYLLPDDKQATDTIFSLKDYTGKFDPEDSVLLVQRALNGSYKTVLGDFFGATGEFPAQLRYNTRHRLVLMNVETGARRVMGTYTPITATTQTITATPEGGIVAPGEPPSATISPQVRRVPAESGVSLSVDPRNGSLDVTNWTVTATVNGTTVWDETSATGSPGTLSKSVDLSGYADETLLVNVTFATANQTVLLQSAGYSVQPAPSQGMTLLDGIANFAGLSPAGGPRSAMTSFLAIAISILGMGAVATTMPVSGEAAGLVGVLMLAGFAAVGWAGYDIVFATGTAVVSFGALRRGL